MKPYRNDVVFLVSMPNNGCKFDKEDEEKKQPISNFDS